jgi:hypothetical protein
MDPEAQHVTAKAAGQTKGASSSSVPGEKDRGWLSDAAQTASSSSDMGSTHEGPHARSSRWSTSTISVSGSTKLGGERGRGDDGDDVGEGTSTEEGTVAAGSTKDGRRQGMGPEVGRGGGGGRSSSVMNLAGKKAEEVVPRRRSAGARPACGCGGGLRRAPTGAGHQTFPEQAP